jgi:hypothetical protein
MLRNLFHLLINPARYGGHHLEYQTMTKRKQRDIPAYQQAKTVGELIECLKKVPENTEWTTDQYSTAGRNIFSITVYDEEGAVAGQIISKI